MLAFDLGGVLLDVHKEDIDPRFFGPHFDAFVLGQINTNEFFDIVSLPTKDFERMCHLKKEPQELLSNIQTPIAFWSNINPVHHEGLARNYYDALSYQVGFKKPDPRFFKRALEIAQLPANKILFLDDRLENIQIAKQFGISTIHVKGDFNLAHFIVDSGIR